MTDPNRAKRVGELAPWPKGNRRNDPRPPKPYATMREFWASLEVELGHLGAKGELAEYLGVHRKLLWDWTSGRKVPSQEYVTAMGRWLRKKLQSSTSASE